MTIFHDGMAAIPVNAKILIVDDSTADVRLILETMRACKVLCEVDHVDNGLECLKYLRKEPPYEDKKSPSIIYLDLNMPRMNGLETLENIRNDEALKHYPVVIMTTSRSDKDILDSYKLNCQAFAVKPMDIMEFHEMVYKLNHFWLQLVALP